MLFTNTDCLCFAKDPAVVRYRSRYWLYYSLKHEMEGSASALRNLPIWSIGHPAAK